MSPKTVWYGKNPEKYRQQSREYYAAHKEQHKKSMQRCVANNKEAYVRRRREYKFKIRYGLTIRQYEELESLQQGKCAICRRKVTHQLHVDHNHKTGKVRGLLCWNCNGALGQVHDSIIILDSMIDYIKKDGQ